MYILCVYVCVFTYIVVPMYEHITVCMCMCVGGRGEGGGGTSPVGCVLVQWGNDEN